MAPPNLMTMPQISILPTGILTVNYSFQIADSTYPAAAAVVLYTVPAVFGGVAVNGLRIMSMSAFNVPATARNFFSLLGPAGGTARPFALSAMPATANLGTNLLNKTDMPKAFLDECGNYVIELFPTDVLSGGISVVCAANNDVIFNMNGRFF